jgi:hypothetical protein
MFGNYIGAMKKEKVFIMCINKWKLVLNEVHVFKKLNEAGERSLFYRTLMCSGIEYYHIMVMFKTMLKMVNCVLFSGCVFRL